MSIDAEPKLEIAQDQCIEEGRQARLHQADGMMFGLELNAEASLKHAEWRRARPRLR